MSDLRPKATHTGKLFDILDCAVLDTGARVVAGGGMARILTGKNNVVAGKVPICILLAEQSASKEEFWARMDAHFSGAGLQLVLFAPKRRKVSSNNGNDGEGGSHAAE